MRSLVLSLLLLAIPRDTSWNDVVALTPGSAVRLRLDAGTIAGDFVSASADRIVVRIRRDDVSVDRTSVTRLERRITGSSRGRNMDIGLGLGLAAGLIRAAVTRDSGLGLAMGALPFMTIGTIAGAAWPAAIWETVYVK